MSGTLGPQFHHRTAYCLRRYVVDASGESEVLWNSRDGLVPDEITSMSGERADYRSQVFAPLHIPAVGDRVFVDITEERARYKAACRIERVEAMERSGLLDKLPKLHDLFPSREAAVDDAFKDFFRPGLPDILTVTAGFLEVLNAERMRMVDKLEERVARRNGSLYYDRNGAPITRDTWLALREQGLDYIRVGYTVIDEHVHVSTVWPGIDHSFRPGSPAGPVISESMVFVDGSGHEQRRYSTEAQALAGHQRMVEAFTKAHRLQHGKRNN